jgi:hypothetical protein
MKPNSVKLGPVVSIAGVRVPVHRALRSLLCAECGAEIETGELFTRWPLPGAAHVFAMPKGECCAPFDFTSEQLEKSPLLRALLAAPAPARRPRKEIDAATRQAFDARLGPVLMRLKRRAGGFYDEKYDKR